jgi:hypothetical protein
VKEVTPGRSTVREVFVVVLSILIAFSLDAWWDRGAEVRDLREGLTTLRAEVRADLSAVEDLASDVQRIAANIDSLVALLPEPAQSVALPDSLLGATVRWRTSDVSTSVFETLIASGSLHLIRDEELSRMITGFPAFLADVQEDEGLGRDYVEYVLSPLLAEAGLATTAYANRGRPGGSGVLRITPPPALTGMLAARRVHLGFSETGLESIQSYQRDLLSRIDTELRQ